MLKANTTELHPKVRPTCISYIHVLLYQKTPSAPSGDYGVASAPACRTEYEQECTTVNEEQCETVQDQVER